MRKMTDKKNNLEKKYEYKFIQFVVSKEEKNRIKELAKKTGTITISNFIREAINEKITRIEQNITPLSQQSDSQMIQEIRNLFQMQSQEQNKILNEMNEKIAENERFYEELLKNFAQIQNYISYEDYKDITEKIYQFVKAHKSVKQQEIMDQFNLDWKESLKILSNQNFFEYNVITGRFSAK